MSNKKRSDLSSHCHTYFGGLQHAQILCAVGVFGAAVLQKVNEYVQSRAEADGSQANDGDDDEGDDDDDDDGGGVGGYGVGAGVA